MKGVTINKKPFDVYEYDDENTILGRYSLEQPDTLPSFFRLNVDENFTLVPNMNLKLDDVRVLIRKMTDENLMDETLVGSILGLFPNLKKQDIGVLWLLEKYTFSSNGKSTKPIDVTHLKMLSEKDSFVNAVRAELTVEEFKRNVERFRKQNLVKIGEERKIFKTLDSIKPLETVDFVVEEVSIAMKLNVPGRENLLDIFDALVTSKEIPLIMLRYKKKVFYKICTILGTIPDSWLDDTAFSDADPSNDGIFFKILNASPNKLASKRTILENLYSECSWSAENVIEYSFKTVEGTATEEKMKEKIVEMIGDRLDYEVVSTKQNHVKGIFLVSSFNFNKILFADLIATNPIFRTFLFFNEDKKTVLSKPRFEPYFSASLSQQNEPSAALRITITPPGDNMTDLPIIVRITHAQRLQQANAAKRILSKLFSISNEEYKSLFDLYSSLVPDFASSFAKKKPLREIKQDMKMGERLVALKKVHPDMYSKESGYPTQCQKLFQPYITSKLERDRLVNDEGWDPHKFIDYEGQWYGCEPRVGQELEKHPEKIWPGLKLNTSKNKPEFVRKYPLLPCCFGTDMYTKNKSEWRVYYAERNKAQNNKTNVPTVPNPKKEDATHILGIGKMAGPGRRGEMPFNWEKILKMLDFKKYRLGKGEKKAKEFYPILRYGVVESPDSFLHCMELARGEKYLSMDEDGRKARIRTVRKNLAKMDVSSGMQNLFDFRTKDIKKILEDPESYISPDHFVDLVQSYYECNIFLYIYGSSSPNGDVVVPRASQAYLYKDIDETRPTVLILKYETGDGDYPYQCEVICEVDIKGGKIQKTKFSFDGKHPVAEKAIQLFYDSNEIFIVDPNSYEPYQPVTE